MGTLVDGSRLDRALAILRLGPDAAATSLAEALWLASKLPAAPELPAEEPAAKPAERPARTQKEAPKAEAGERKSPARTDSKPKLRDNPDPRRLYAPETGKPEAASIPATWITVPTADALPSRLAIERALKPFLKRFPSRRLWQLDTAKTAEASADRRAVTPVFSPLPERWFSVLLLVEQTDAMEVWTDTVRELQMLLGRHGAFRHVRMLRYAVTRQNPETLSLFSASGQPVAARAALDPEGRSLCLILTNGTSPEWRRRPLLDFVQALGLRTSVAIIQMLPRERWSHTALGDALERVHTATPGAPNAALRVEDPFSGIDHRAEDASCVPILTLEPRSLTQWAGFLMSSRREVQPAIQLARRETSPVEVPQARTPAERLAAFRGTASQQAFQLLRVLAGAPLTIPIMRLVQQCVSASRERFHLAEVMLSGLIERVTPADAPALPDEVFYDFVPGIRDLLLGTLSGGESQSLDDAMAPAQEKLRAFVEAHTSTAIRDFRALLSDPLGVERLPESARFFVEVSRQIYVGRGLLPPAESTAELPTAERELPFGILRTQLATGPFDNAVVSGQGEYIASLKFGTAQFLYVWNRATAQLQSDQETRTRITGEDFLDRPDRKIRIFPAADTDQLYARIDRFLIPLVTVLPPAHRIELAELHGAAFNISPDAAWGVAVTRGLTQVWSLTTGELVATHPNSFDVDKAFGHPTVTAVPRTGLVIRADHMLIGDSHGFVRILSASFRAPNSIVSIKISADGLSNLILDASGSAFTLDAETLANPVFLSQSGVTAIAMNAEASLVATGADDGTITLWDFGRMAQVATLQHGQASVRSVSLSASGAYLVSASEDGLTSWDLSSLLQSGAVTVRKPKPKIGRVRPPRVQLTYDVQTGDAIELREVPFIVGVLANLSGDLENPLPELRERKFREIDPDNFDPRLRNERPQLKFTVEDKFNVGARLKIDLLFQSMEDFSPGNVAQQIAPLQQLLASRNLLVELRQEIEENHKLGPMLHKAVTTRASLERLWRESPSRQIDPDLANEPLAAAETFESSTGPRRVEEPFLRPISLQDEIVRTGWFGREESAAAHGSELVQNLVDQVLRGTLTISGDLEASITARVVEIDRLLSLQLDEVLHHTTFQALEATWRGLRYLVDQTETGPMLKIKVLNVSKQELLNDLRESGEASEGSALYRKVCEEEYEIFGGIPFGAIVGDYTFGRSPEDIDLLERMSHVAATAHAPFLSAVRPEMFNHKSFRTLDRTRDLAKMFDGTEFGRWKDFRASDDSRYVALTLPHMLLRLPYGRDTHPVEAFDYEERQMPNYNLDYLWGNAAYALAARLTHAFAMYGWCAAIRGVEGGGVVEGLATHHLRDAESGEVFLNCPTEVTITERRQKELAGLGFVPLVHCKGTDYAAFFDEPTVHKAAAYQDTTVGYHNTRLAAQLPYVLVVSRFAHYLKVLMRDKIGSSMNRAEAEMYLNWWLAHYVLADDSDSQEAKAQRPLREGRIDVQEVPGTPGSLRAVAFLRPHFQLDELTADLRLVVDLPSSAKY